jgi:hypothetical protein
LLGALGIASPYWGMVCGTLISALTMFLLLQFDWPHFQRHEKKQKSDG